MNSHPYLRAYMAGIAVPTPLLLVALTLFSIARFVYNVPIPVERVIIFPMAIVPNLFGVWNVLRVASGSRLPLGIHGAILHQGFSYFDLVQVHYMHVLLVFPAVLIVYYLVWKYLIGFFNRVAGIAE